MKVGDTDSVNGKKIIEQYSKKATQSSSEKKTQEAVATKKTTDTVDVKSYNAIDPSTIAAERKAKVEQLKKIIQEGGVQKYLASVPVTGLLRGLSEETGLIRDLVGADESTGV